MNNQAKLTLTIGIILIVAQLAKEWSTIRGIIFTPSGASAAGGANTGPGGLPWFYWPGTPIPLVQQTPKKVKA